MQTHTDTQTQGAALPPSSSQSEKSDQKAEASSLLLSNGGPLTQTAGVTKQLNGGSEKAGNWLVVITHNFSPIFFKVSWPTDGSVEGEEAMDANTSAHINWTTQYRYCSSQQIEKTFQQD